MSKNSWVDKFIKAESINPIGFKLSYEEIKLKIINVIHNKLYKILKKELSPLNNFLCDLQEFPELNEPRMHADVLKDFVLSFVRLAVRTLLNWRYYTDDYFFIEDIKQSICKEIDQEYKKYIEIDYPRRDFRSQT